MENAIRIIPPVTLNETSMTRVRIMLDRAAARGEGKSIENFVEDLIDLAVDVKGQRWDSADKGKDRRLFAESLTNLGVLDNAGNVVKPDIFAKLVNKYHMV